MEIRLRSTGQVMMESEFRYYQKTNNGPTWDQTTDEILEALGADVVFNGPQAQPGRYQTAYRDGVEQLEGKWYTKYILGPVFVDGETTAAEQEAAYKAKKDAEFATSARSQRDTLLKETDWVVIKSLENAQSIPSDWATYRQALRDIPQQSGFPISITWPAKP